MLSEQSERNPRRGTPDKELKQEILEKISEDDEELWICKKEVKLRRKSNPHFIPPYLRPSAHLKHQWDKWIKYNVVEFTPIKPFTDILTIISDYRGELEEEENNFQDEIKECKDCEKISKDKISDVCKYHQIDSDFRQGKISAISELEKRIKPEEVKKGGGTEVRKVVKVTVSGKMYEIGKGDRLTTTGAEVLEFLLDNHNTTRYDIAHHLSTGKGNVDLIFQRLYKKGWLIKVKVKKC